MAGAGAGERVPEVAGEQQRDPGLAGSCSPAVPPAGAGARAPGPAGGGCCLRCVPGFNVAERGRESEPGVAGRVSRVRPGGGQEGDGAARSRSPERAVPGPCRAGSLLPPGQCPSRAAIPVSAFLGAGMGLAVPPGCGALWRLPGSFCLDSRGCGEVSSGEVPSGEVPSPSTSLLGFVAQHKGMIKLKKLLFLLCCSRVWNQKLRSSPNPVLSLCFCLCSCCTSRHG